MVGFGFGDAVIMELVKDKGLLPESLKSGNVDDLVYPMNAALRPAAMGIAARLRASGRSVDLVIEDGKKPKWAFKHAERCGASRVVLLGEKEWEQGVVRVKDLATREEVDVKPEDLC
jgi:histidyl-tRNA synthetase